MEEPPGEPSHRRPAEIELVERSGRGVGQLGPLRAWAVGFADLGTSIYFVPGILFAELGAVAPSFVFLATLAFVFFALRYRRVAERYPKGGGGVAAALDAFGPRVSVLSGALLVSAYLLTIAISVVTALHYISVLRPWSHEVEILSVVAILVLGVLNWVGIRELARLATVLALLALAVDGVLLVAVVAQLGPAHWAELIGNLGHLSSIGFTEIATGLAMAWLAYAGIESLGQLTPALRRPRKQVMRTASALVMLTVMLTVPLFTALAVEAASAGGIAPQGALLLSVALEYGGRKLVIALALTGAGLLLLAANVAFIGCYNIFQVLGEQGYLPAAVARRHARFGTPRGAIVVIVVGSIALIMATRADMVRLGNLFAFGLLGSYAITSLSLDVLTWREGWRTHRRRFSWLFPWAVGGLVTLTLLLPWVTSWFTRPNATLYGAAVTGAQLLIALATRRGWVRAGRLGFLKASSAERAAAGLPGALEVVTLDEALALKQTYPSTTMLALRSPNRGLCREAARRARGVGDAAVYVIFVDEVPGLLFPPRTGPSEEAVRVLTQVTADLKAEGIDAVPLWRLAHDAGGSISEAAEQLGIKCVLVGVTQRWAVTHLLRGDVLKDLVSDLPDSIHVVICE